MPIRKRCLSRRRRLGLALGMVRGDFDELTLTMFICAYLAASCIFVRILCSNFCCMAQFTNQRNCSSIRTPTRQRILYGRN